MKKIDPSKIAGYAVIGAIVLAAGAYGVMKINDNNTMNIMEKALMEAAKGFEFADGDSWESVTTDFTVPTTVEYKSEEFTITWTESSDLLEIKDVEGVWTVEVTNSEDKREKVFGQIEKNGLTQKIEYRFDIKKTA